MTRQLGPRENLRLVLHTYARRCHTCKHWVESPAMPGGDRRWWRECRRDPGVPMMADYAEDYVCDGWAKEG